MDTAKVVVGHIQAHSRSVAFELLGKPVRQPGEPPRSHADRKISTLDVGGGDFRGHARHHFGAYRYYSARAVAVRRVLAQIGYGQRLHNDAMGAVAEGVAHGKLVGMEAVSTDLGRSQDAPAEVLDEFVKLDTGDAEALDEGPVTLTFPADLSSESYEDLEAHLQLILRKAKRRSGFRGSRPRRLLVRSGQKMTRPPTEAAKRETPAIREEGLGSLSKAGTFIGEV